MLRTASKMALPNMGRSYPDRSSLDDKYRFKPLPVTEAAATSTAFVCEFTGGSSANETGVGGGLSGADLVFQQYGGPPAAVDGYRQITKAASMAFGPTVGFMNNFMQSALGMSILWRFKDLDPGTASENHLCYMYSQTTGLSATLMMQSANRRSFNLSFNLANGTDGFGVTAGNSDVSSSNSADTGFLAMLSLDFVTRTAFGGIVRGQVQPTKLSDMLYFGMNRGDVAFAGASAISGFAYSGTTDSIVGSHISYAPTLGVGVKVGSVTVAKYPCFVPV